MKFEGKKHLFAFLLFIFPVFIFAEIPAGYYNGTENKTGEDLKTALHNIIREHIYLNYNSSTNIWWYDYFMETDWHPDGYFWDMYSNDQYDRYNGASVQNREHSMPRSWWGVSENYHLYDANGDLHNLYPSNAAANEQKSNFPLGEVGSISYTNGVTKVGRSGMTGYVGTVFEPADEYKGDFARTYMYMVTCYEDYAGSWRSLSPSMIINSTSNLNNYARRLLMKWHIDDPVSEKEINRNNAVYAIQNNRNPFIDNPQFAQLIWGNEEIDDVELYLYPNPANEFIYAGFSDTNIEFESVVYSVYSVNGVLMEQNTLSSDTRVSLNYLDNGLYIFVAYVNGQRITKKFVINKSQ